MRLSDRHIAAIKQATHDVFGDDAVVRLFGSRADDDARGGDIDLHIEADPAVATMRNEVRFRAAIWRDLGEDQVDVVLMPRGTAERWIDRAALKGRIL